MLKIAINLTREHVGGITSSNINLINHLYGLDYEFVGLELNSRMYMKGTTLFRNFAPEVFDYHIINIHHLPVIDIMKKAKNIRDVETAYQEPIKIIKRHLERNKARCNFVKWQLLHSLAHIDSGEAGKDSDCTLYSGVLSRETKSQPAHMRALFSSMRSLGGETSK